MGLTLVPTPIGNLGDMTQRAIEVLQKAAVVLCEDTRHSGPVLARWGVTGRKVSYQKFNERERIDQVLAFLKEGLDVALISDAGTPGISDPGELLVKEVLQAGYEVDCLPGATALVPALVMSGLPTRPALFLGFPPDKEGDFACWIADFAQVPATLVLYLSPHKVEKQLSWLVQALGDRPCCLCREISKIHQQNLRHSLSQLVEVAQEQPLRGELVLVLQGFVPQNSSTQWQSEARQMTQQGGSLKDVSVALSQKYGVSKNQIKKFLLES